MKRYSIVFLIVLVCIAAQAQTYKSTALKKQTSSSKFDPKKLTFGGNFGLGFGSNDYWGISLSPQVGYRFTPKLTAGVGFSYLYSSEKYSSYGYDWKYTSNYLGFNTFGSYYPIEQIILTIKPEILRIWETQKSDSHDNSAKYSNSKFIPAVVVGGGIRLRPITLTINYDLVQDKDSPYGDSAYFSFGFLF